MEKEEKQNIMQEIFIYLLPMWIAIVIEILFKLNNGYLGLTTNSLIFSIFLIYIIYGILISIFKKNSTTIKIICVISYILLLINQIKILYCGEPITFTDINFLQNASEIAGLTFSTIVKRFLPYIISFIILAIIFVILIKYAKENEKILNNKKARIIIVFFSIIILFILFYPNEYTKNIYLKTVFESDKYKDYDSYTTTLSYYQNYTLLSGMWGDLLNNNFCEPENYNEKELAKNLEKVEERSKKWGQPNIILVFSEAFWDIEQLGKEVEFEPSVTSNLENLKNHGKIIDLLSCSYGGMSENVSFELLTGASMNYFPNGYIPIMSLYKRKNIEKAPSIVKELNKNGYKSKIAFGRDYYNSKNAFLKLGFNEYKEFEETQKSIKGNFISDSFVTTEIIEELENKEEENKLFYLAETIQNHMPFTIEKYDEYDIKIKNTSLDKDIQDTLLAYAQGVYDADKQLNRLYEYIKQYKEPTILIFLGDHLPYLYTKEGKDCMEYLNYFNTEYELENTYRKYNTQALILSNYEIDYSEVPDYLSCDLLLTYITNQMDIKLQNYYKWLYTTIEQLPAVNKNLFLNSKGNKYALSQMNESQKELYKLKNNMQYKFFLQNTK